jgi:hypothetical protein
MQATRVRTTTTSRGDGGEMGSLFSLCSYLYLMSLNNRGDGVIAFIFVFI